ncbi:MAG: PEP-CTERM sorting domain-containing protein [Rubrivivax sp.]|jgi:hypothetical protein|nr:PEP-CTERM sorting domain-containing protein [Rubrivivax sp.]
MQLRALAAALAATAAILSSGALAAPIVFSSAGAGAADLTATVDAFRAVLGANLGAAPNPTHSPGRREINWDAGAALDGVADPNLMPGNQFNGLASPFARGAQFATPGSGFMISRRCAQDGQTFPCGGSDILLGMGPAAGNNVNFRAFSAERIFTPIGSNIMDVRFAVPGSAGVTASTRAFGAVFLDVEVANLTTMEFFDASSASLGVFGVPVAPDGGFSFLGVQFGGGERVARVRLTLGDMSVLAHGQFSDLRNDLVALDDFIYAEPAAVPEPATWALLAIGAAALVRRRRRR